MARLSIQFTFVSKLFLFDDKEVIGFRYKDGKAAINFSDVKSLAVQGFTGSDLD